MEIDTHGESQLKIDAYGESQKSPEIAFIFALFDFKSNFKAQNYNKKTTPKSKMEKIFKKLKIISNKGRVNKSSSNKSLYNGG